MLPRGIGCGAARADGAAGVVSAQNQPILVSVKKKNVSLREKQGKVYRAEEDGMGGGDCRERQIRAGFSIVIALGVSSVLRLATHM
jgi:hypothetical protein